MTQHAPETDSDGNHAPTLGVGMIGYAFMGRAHSQAWRTVGSAFDLPVAARKAALCGRDDTATRSAARRLGWDLVETDWRAVVERDDVDIVDICTPGDSHAEIAIAALAAGKHVLCEKPLANTVAKAEAMVAAAEQARARGARSMVGFNYRRVPATVLVRDLIASGRIGHVRHVRAVYLQDWIVDPDLPPVWRLQRDRAGSGALCDIGAHIVDLAQYVVGDRLTGVSGLTETFVKERPLLDGTEDPRTAGFRRILVTEPTHPYIAAWWPPGHIIGYEHSFTHEIRDFLEAVAPWHRPRAFVRRRSPGAAHSRRSGAQRGQEQRVDRDLTLSPTRAVV